MKINSLAGKPAPPEILIDVPYVGSFRDKAHLQKILDAAQIVVDAALAVPAPPPAASAPHRQTVREAVEVWENEGNPN